MAFASRRKLHNIVIGLLDLISILSKADFCSNQHLICLPFLWPNQHLICLPFLWPYDMLQQLKSVVLKQNGDQNGDHMVISW